jgi:hypothetical protein
MSKVKDVVRARIKARIAAQHQPAQPGLGSVTLEKTKAELQDELTAAGIDYPKNARKAELEALLSEPRIAADYAESAE